MFTQPRELAAHVNEHVAGLFPGHVDPAKMLELDYKPCPRCCKFFLNVGGSHKRSCDAKSLVVRDELLNSALADDGSFLPSLEDVFTLPIPTLGSVPTGCQQAWGTVLEKTLLDVATSNSVEAWTRLFMLPKCVLVASKRGGKRNRGDRLSVSYLCDAWTRGDLKWLWTRASRSVSSKARTSGPDLKRAVETAITHVRHGRLGKACATLSSSGLAPDNDTTRDKLIAKHPVAPPPLVVELVDGDSPALKLGHDFNLKSILTSFAKDVGSDGTNFRVQHLLDACSASLSRPVLSTLRSVINLLLSGNAHEDIRLFLAGAKLTALAKGDSDVRPIAAGNVFRRIASKCVCQINQSRFRAALGKHQVGVACPAGAESVIHLTREVMDRKWSDPDFVLLKVDFANAFNAIDRQVLLEQCAKLFPDLLPWVQWCYGDRPWLIHQTGRVSSCVGVQQGDPLGPLLFCLVLHLLVTRVAADCPDLDLHRWYLDDGVLAGPSRQVLRALTLLRKHGPTLGLHLNLGKCELFSPDLDNFGLSELVDDDLSSFPAMLNQRSDVPHFELLGSPFGDVEFCSAVVKRLCAANRKLLDRISSMGDPQAALHLLRTCASFGKFVYLTRTTPPELVRVALAECDLDIRACFSSLAALQLTDRAWSQARLSLSHGGIGLRSVAEHCAAAYITSHIRALPGVVTAHLVSAVDIFSQQLGPDGNFDLDRLLETPPKQRALSTRLEKLGAAALRAGCTQVDGLRLSSVEAPRSAAWLMALPCRGPLDLTLEPDQMQVALQHRLGLPLSVAGEKCCFCGSALDLLGHHHLTCSSGDYRTSRHNQLRNALFTLCGAAGLSPQKEQGSFEHDRTRPADVLVPAWKLGKSAAFDLTVVSPLTKQLLKGAGDDNCVTAAAMKKHAENDAKCADLHWLCIPLAVDSYGQWCDEAHTAFVEIASHLSTRTKVSLSVALASIFNTLGLILTRHNAIAVLARRAKPFSIGAAELLSSSSSYR